MSRNRIMYVLAGSLLVLVGYVIGSLKEPRASYAQSGRGNTDRAAIAVSVPTGGFAVVEGTTGSGVNCWWAVDHNGLASSVRAEGKVIFVHP